MPSTCVFEFDRPDPVYITGETISGRIQLTTTKKKKVRDVSILFEGTAKVHWQESRSRYINGNFHLYTEHFRSKINYVQTRSSVFGEGTLAPGTYTYIFLIPLPEGCPTSCVGKYGKIFYEIKLILDRPLRFDNVFTQPITVIQQSNLNLLPNLLIPIQDENINYLCCWPCASGPVTSTLTLPFGGYAPGQIIIYKLEISNESRKFDLDGIEVKFEQNYKFTAHSPYRKTKTKTNTLARAELNTTVLHLSRCNIEGELLVPAVPPSSEDNEDGIITISYNIKIIIRTGSCHIDSEMEIPIKIGTVPLIQSATDPIHSTAMIQPSPTAPDAANITELPRYEKATVIGGKFIDTDVDQHNCTDGFIPKYPMYRNWTAPATAPPPTQTSDSTEAVDAPLLQSANNSAQGPPDPVDGVTMPMPPTATYDGKYKPLSFFCDLKIGDIY